MDLTLVVATLIGVVAGLRTFIAPAAVAWAAHWGMVDLSATPFAFLGHRYAPWIVTLLAIGELIGDQLPSTPSRTVPMQFGARILSGAVSGAAVGAASGSLAMGAGLGGVGAVAGTLGGARARAWMADHFGSDRPAALIEDAVAMGAAALLMAALA